MSPRDDPQKASVYDSWLDDPELSGAGHRDVPKKAFICPHCHGSGHTGWGMSHILILHWVLNPGLAVNELLFGQRIPKQMFICNGCRSSFASRTFVHCPWCGIYSESMIWSGTNGFGHWLGIVCPECGRGVPTLANAVTWAVSAGLALAYRILGRPFLGRLLAWQRRYLAWEWGRTARAHERLVSSYTERARA